jgi:hypothetical protein
VWSLKRKARSCAAGAAFAAAACAAETDVQGAAGHAPLSGRRCLLSCNAHGQRRPFRFKRRGQLLYETDSNFLSMDGAAAGSGGRDYSPYTHGRHDADKGQLGASTPAPAPAPAHRWNSEHELFIVTGIAIGLLAVCSLSSCCACSASLHNKAEVWLLRHPLPNPARHLSWVVIHDVVLPCDWQRWRRLMRLWLHGVQSAVNAQDSLSQQRLLLAMPLAMPDSTFPPRALSEGGGWRWKGAGPGAARRRCLSHWPCLAPLRHDSA